MFFFISISFFPCYVKIKRTQVTDRRKHPRFIFYKEGVSQILLQKAWLWISVGNVVGECRALCRGKTPSGHSQKRQAYCSRDKILHLSPNPNLFMLFKWLSNVLDSVGPILSLFYVVYYGVFFVLVLDVSSIPYIMAIQVNLKMCLL